MPNGSVTRRSAIGQPLSPTTSAITGMLSYRKSVLPRVNKDALFLTQIARRGGHNRAAIEDDFETGAQRLPDVVFADEFGRSFRAGGGSGFRGSGSTFRFPYTGSRFAVRDTPGGEELVNTGTQNVWREAGPHGLAGCLRPSGGHGTSAI